MVMALSLFFREGDSAIAASAAAPFSTLTLVAGFEDGVATVSQQLRQDGGGGGWAVVYRCAAHSQPVLSLDVVPPHM